LKEEIRAKQSGGKAPHPKSADPFWSAALSRRFVFLLTMTPVLAVAAHAPSAEVIARAAEVLRRGGLVAFPTETVYGLGANALDAEAVARIFQAKGRPASNPLIVHLPEAPQPGPVVAAWPDRAARLAARFWPGPLTLVLPRGPAVPDAVTAGGPTVAVRVPAHPVALALLQATGLPLAAPSANSSTRLSPTRAEHVLRDLVGRIDLILDGGPTRGGIESTVLDLTAEPPRLLRPGLIEPAAVEEVLGSVARPSGAPAPGPLPSPGMLARHYAPRTLLECVEGDGRGLVETLHAAGLRVGWLTHFTTPTERPLPGVVRGQLPADPAGYAAGLYAALHWLDGQGLDRIVVALPPDSEEWLAVRDRLRRASA
jgi:L-threonylcarbamoyladenylate synthase